jgi:excisionase family DNA binding protein
MLPQEESEAMSICSTAISKEAREGMKPLAVSVKIACKLVGVGNTTMWALIKAGRVKTISIGRRRLVVYASLELLLTPEAETAS